MKYNELISQMTLEEKAKLCSGTDTWHCGSLERLGIPEIMMTDGPHGLRKEQKSNPHTVPATCFPTSSATACSWDTDLLERIGKALGDECRREGVSILLGPGVNIKRSPLCGRNFEYFSEDPYLAGKLGAAWVRGVQSRGVGASLKHFAANSQETRRMSSSSVMDERTLREIYLPAFETVVKEAQPWTVMSAYNLLNGVYCSENRHLLTDILKGEWGHEGMVLTDWSAENDIAEGIKNGQELEMPYSGKASAERIIKAVESGDLSEERLDEAIDRILAVIFRASETLENGQPDFDPAKHNALAREAAASSMVLLKNEDNIMPLDRNKKYAVIGEFAVNPRYQGIGSSKVNPLILSNALDSLKEAGFETEYAPGYDGGNSLPDDRLIGEACRAAKKCDAAIVFIGLAELCEAEGYDRLNMELPAAHIELLNAVHSVNKNIIVVLSCGSAVEMPWENKAKGILLSHLAGQAGGAAVSDILSGEANPCGKLAETYPFELSDTPCADFFPAKGAFAEYREGLYVGYRYYDTAGVPVRYPFGFGLSYTEFKYSALKISRRIIGAGDSVEISFKIKNTGDRAGAEIAQIYVSDIDSTAFRPEKELKGFVKVFLEAGEEKRVSVILDERAFAYYNTAINDWHIEDGVFRVLIGASSADIRLRGSLRIKGSAEAEIPDLRETAPSYYSGEIRNVSDGEFEALLGCPIPKKNESLTLSSTLEDAKNTRWGRLIYKAVRSSQASAENPQLAEQASVQVPIKNFVLYSGGLITDKMADGILMILGDNRAAKGAGIIAKEFVKTLGKRIKKKK